MKTDKYTTPLTESEILDMRIGDKVLLSGYIYTARDAAHKKWCDLLEAGKSIPL
ncbi:MAG: fumarate hydratase C-terminal domain-containing protein, partial [Victivallales bacterium]|nr:fumarate hydratase C-terminal domain-containing protein [Victivallales bacterium]